MTKQTYEKARRIQRDIKDLYTLRNIACYPYINFSWVKKFLWMSADGKVALCDDGLKDVIKKYCDERIKELKEELEAL